MSYLPELQSEHSVVLNKVQTLVPQLSPIEYVTQECQLSWIVELREGALIKEIPVLHESMDFLKCFGLLNFIYSADFLCSLIFILILKGDHCIKNSPNMHKDF